MEGAIDCFGETGEASVNVSGGTPGYTYSWSTGATSASISGLVEGTYSVTVTDSKGCVDSAQVSLVEPVALMISTTSLDVTCNGDTDGFASASASGGTPGYSYNWSTGANTASISGLVAGTYGVTVTDANGCQDSSEVIVNEPPVLVLTPSMDDVECNGEASGSASVSVSGGTPGYTYSWSTGATTASVADLAVGTYGVTVTDANGCKDSTQVMIDEPTNLVVNASTTDVECNGEASGTATASVGGGTPGYSYSWSTGATTASVADLAAGSYGVTVTDANGCQDSTQVMINEPNNLVVNAINLS